VTAAGSPGMAGSDRIPVGKAILAVLVMLVVLVGLTATTKLVVDDSLSEDNPARRATCLTVPAPTIDLIRERLGATGGRRVRAWGARPAGDSGWTFVSAEMAHPSAAPGAIGEIATWRVRGGAEDLVIESVDQNARRFSSWAAAPAAVETTDAGGIDSRWCAKNRRPH
jgi:hypothetical protein